MIGIPQVLNTKQDWLNALECAKADSSAASGFKARLIGLRDNRYMKTLKASSASKSADDQTLDDYEQTDDPAAEIYRLGFTVSAVESMIKELA
jgi:hypothetical protein